MSRQTRTRSFSGYDRRIDALHPGGGRLGDASLPGGDEGGPRHSFEVAGIASIQACTEIVFAGNLSIYAPEHDGEKRQREADELTLGIAQTTKSIKAFLRDAQ